MYTLYKNVCVGNCLIFVMNDVIKEFCISLILFEVVSIVFNHGVSALRCSIMYILKRNKKDSAHSNTKYHQNYVVISISLFLRRYS